jgi:hypothetical protein
MLPPPGPALVASLTSGVDGSSEGGRLSTMRLPYTLVLYGVALIDEVKRRGYKGKLAAEPALVDGYWVLKLVYDGDPPKDVPELWMGHRAVLEKASPPPPPPAPKST